MSLGHPRPNEMLSPPPSKWLMGCRFLSWMFDSRLAFDGAREWVFLLTYMRDRWSPNLGHTIRLCQGGCCCCFRCCLQYSLWYKNLGDKLGWHLDCRRYKWGRFASFFFFLIFGPPFTVTVFHVVALLVRSSPFEGCVSLSFKLPSARPYGVNFIRADHYLKYGNRTHKFYITLSCNTF